jgi:hypothetical protein
MLIFFFFLIIFVLSALSVPHHHSPLQSTAGLWASSTLEGFAIISTLGRRVGDRSIKSYFTRERCCPFPVQSSSFVASYDTLGKRRGGDNYILLCRHHTAKCTYLKVFMLSVLSARKSFFLSLITTKIGKSTLLDTIHQSALGQRGGLWPVLLVVNA